MTLLNLLLLILVSLSSCTSKKGRAILLSEVTLEPNSSLIKKLCHKQIVLLGEQSHGDGSVFAFKSKLVKVLHRHCGFDTVVFESGMYDLWVANQLLKKRNAKEELALEKGILKLWSSSEEFKILIDYIYETQEQGRPINVFGADYQLSGQYSNSRLVPDLEKYFGKLSCRKELSKWGKLFYYINRPLYTNEVKTSLYKCLQRAEEAIKGDSLSMQEVNQIVFNLKELLLRDLGKGGSLSDRDKVMAENLLWIANSPAKGKKIIFWGASSHIAKSVKGIINPRPEINEINEIYKSYIPLGEIIHKAYGTNSYHLGFIAYSGSAGTFNMKPESIGNAPDDSLEGMVAKHFNGNLSFIDFDQKELKGVISNIPARPLGHVFMEANWSNHFDGFIWIRELSPVTRRSVTY
jgi:erythromycin esterase